ncbi:hypothetical protein M413DRAFT_20446 [Hebeloma cylindrosporum]|uniref:Mitochondrial distribution and morphology protein 35 n=1 Tax=Hebeloma cylindrosporum TaxID=76867 RepID=A0A0C3BIW0_HEBCY|nr:hypothetical protein M413DRAFT_20446 [Hebeloma cylindrosporum h7]
MSQSVSPKCTPLKQEYDACFNSWFEGYLEPAVAIAECQERRTAYSHMKAEEFQRKCGKVWEQYKSCVQQAVQEKGLDTLLQQARDDNPLMEPPSAPPTK